MMSFNCVKRFKSGVSKKLARSKRRSSLHSMPRGVEVLESRELLATFPVTNLRNYGAGSLRQAIIESNKRPGADTIDFDVAGTILNCKTSLPAITDTLTIDGSTAPSFAGSPVVTLDSQGSSGLRFARGSDGSILRDLSLVNAGNAGVTLSASDVTVQGNFIGLLADGKTIAGNRGDGVQINASSHDDLIGQSNPISYCNADAVSMQPVSAWQGIRNSDTSGQYLITLINTFHRRSCRSIRIASFDRELAGAGSVRRFFFNVRRLCSHVRRLCSHRIMAFPSRHGNHSHPPAALAKTCDGQ